MSHIILTFDLIGLRQDWINGDENQGVLLVRSEIAPAAIATMNMTYHQICETNDSSCMENNTLDVQSVELSTPAKDVV